MSNLRQLVLQSFKKLHRTRKKVFAGDERTLEAARIKINEEYSKNKHVKDEDSIRAMVKFGEDVANELKTQVIQARQIKPGVYMAKITDDTMKLENIPFNENAILDEKVGKKSPCCRNKTDNKLIT